MVPAPLVPATQPDRWPQQWNLEDMEFNPSPTRNISMPLLCHCQHPSPSLLLIQTQRWSSLAQLLFLRLLGLPWSSIELQCSGCPLFNHCSGFSETSSHCPALSWIFSLPIPSSPKHSIARQGQPAAGLGVLAPCRALVVPQHYW